MKKVMLILAVLSFMVFVGTASALSYLTGSINFTGGANLTGGDFLTATGIEFIDAEVYSATGDFSALAGKEATFTDFQFDTFDGPFTPFWEVDEYSFDLLSLTSVLRQCCISGASDFLNISGAGTFNAPGYEATTGIWSFTTQSSTNEITVSFSASAAAVPVPEPGTLLLLGSGLAGLALYRRRSMKK